MNRSQENHSQQGIEAGLTGRGLLLGLLALLVFAGGWWLFYQLGFPAREALIPAPTMTPSLTPTLVFTPTVTVTPIPLFTATPTPLPAEITNAKGVNMRLVPAGEFTMGDNADDALAECRKYNDCKRDWFTNEEPPHTVYLDAFYMDTYEVTNALYRACVEAGVCKAPQASSSYYGNSQYDNYPVIYVDWNQAQTYCEWRSARLPTEAEWEKAARGTDGRAYPWGNQSPNKTLANYDNNAGKTTAVGSYPKGVSPYGIYDMAGNVWEWTADWYDATYYKNSPARDPQGPASGEYRVLRGGGWFSLDLVSNVRSAYRIFSGLPTYTDYYVGFRCARSAK